MKVNCFEYMYYDRWNCMFQYASKAILYETRECSDFKKGEYSEEEVEKSFFNIE